MEVVVVHPGLQLACSVVRTGIGEGTGPLAQERLDEPLGFAVGPGRVGPGAGVLDAQSAQQLGEAT